MLRWLLVVFLLCTTGCKIVHSTAGADAGTTADGLTIGFASEYSTVSEEAGIVSVVIALDAPADAPISATFNIVNDTAVYGSDFAYVGPTKITLERGEVAHTITIEILADGLVEPEETFYLELVAAQGAVIGRKRHYVTIWSAELPIVNFETASSFVSEHLATGIALWLSEPSTETVTAHLRAEGTASTADYTLPGLTVTFPPGSVRVVFTPVPIDDDIAEPNEIIRLYIDHVAWGRVGPMFVHEQTILDNDSPPTVAFELPSQQARERDTAEWSVSATLRLSAASGYPIEVPFTVATTGTADAQDYTVASVSPIQFAPGQTTAIIWLAITGDTILEGNETVILELGEPTNATLGAVQQHTVTITNDDCLGSGAFAVCPAVPLLDAVTLPAELDTGSDPLCHAAASSLLDWTTAGQPDACVVFARHITVSTTRAFGPRPLVLAATETLTVSGVLDASGRRDRAGPGSGAAACQPFAGTPGSRAGGAGGSFMTAGGNGGAHTNPDGAAGLAAAADAMAPAALRGGCPGQLGGDNAVPQSAGAGGGAVYLVAGSSLVLEPGAAIDASGDGAIAGGPSSGGSGGGSGGMIVLDAPSIVATGAFVVANGGGGASGGATSHAGTDGSPPNPTTPLVPAAGGTGGPGGSGGGGFAEASPAGTGMPGNNNSGGGGGGGGAGYIRASQPLGGASVSPAAH